MKLQKIKLREMSKNTKNKIWNGSILAAFIAAAAVFIIMLQAEKKVLAEYEKITVCVTIDDLPKGESITEDNILNYVQTVLHFPASPGSQHCLFQSGVPLFCL